MAKAVAKKPVKKTVTKTAPKKTASQKVDYYPNRMTFLVAALAAVSLVVLGLIATYSQ